MVVLSFRRLARLVASAAILSSLWLTCGVASVHAADDLHASVVSSVSFDGAGESGQGSGRDHGRRLSEILACNDCHAADYTGVDFGAMIPLVEGLWAGNISRTMPGLTDGELETLLREGIHPDREIYLMPSKSSQFLSERDMDALIDYLRTVKPAGEPTPLPPRGFEAAVTARLPESYWRTTEEGAVRNYHNSAEEADYFAEHTVPDLGDDVAQGRLIAQTVCASCHGAALDGMGEPAGDMQSLLEYDDVQFENLLRDAVDRSGQPLVLNWGSHHAPPQLTGGEIQQVMAYARRLAQSRAE